MLGILDIPVGGTGDWGSGCSGSDPGDPSLGDIFCNLIHLMEFLPTSLSISINRY